MKIFILGILLNMSLFASFKMGAEAGLTYRTIIYLNGNRVEFYPVLFPKIEYKNENYIINIIYVPSVKYEELKTERFIYINFGAKI